MIVDIANLSNGIEVSYVNDKGGIDIKTYRITERPYEFPIWELADQVLPEYANVRDYKGLPVKRGYAKHLDTFGLLTFLLNLPREEQDMLFKYNQPKLYFFDIETEISDEGFEGADTARMPINCISTCDEECNALIQTTLTLTDDIDLIARCGGRKPTIDDVYAYINELVQEYMAQSCFKQFLPKQPFVKVIEHNNEYDMLQYWLGSVCKWIPALSGWNIWNFDLPYVKNRLSRYGLSFALASLVGKADYRGMPMHKWVDDYMMLMDKYDYSVWNKENLKLDYIAKRIFNAGKLPYDCSLKELYLKHQCKFCAYNAIDTMVNNMISIRTNLLQTIMGLSSVTGIPMNSCQGPVKQSEGLLMSLMIKENIENGPAGKQKVVAQGSAQINVYAFEGGFVKEPFKHHARYAVCCDHASLYPSCMRSFNLSPFNYIRRLSDPKEIEHYKKDPNYIVTVLGGLYLNDRDYEYKTSQVFLGDKRNEHKHLQFYYANNHVRLIEEELERRGLLKI